MSNETPKKTNGLTIVVIIIVLLGIGGIINHVSNQLNKTDTITNLFVGGLFSTALVVGVIYFSKNK